MAFLATSPTTGLPVFRVGLSNGYALVEISSRIRRPGRKLSATWPSPVDLLAPTITSDNPAVLVRDFPAAKTYVLTGYDVLQAM